MLRRLLDGGERLGRRDFLTLGALGTLGGLSLADALRADETEPAAGNTAKNVVMIWLAGGPPTIDMWDPKPDAPAEIRGEFGAIDTSVTGVQLSDQLPQIARVMDKCLIVRSLHHSIPAHGPGTVYLHSGNKPTPAMQYPSLGSLASHLLPSPDDMPPYVVFGDDRGGSTLAGHLGDAFNPFQVEGNARNGRLRVRGVSLPQSITIDDFRDRVRLLDTFDYRMSALDKAADVVSGLDQFQRKAINILRANTTREAFDLDSEPGALRNRYGRDGFGQTALAARRLIEAGVRFVTFGTGGWDTHSNNFGKLRRELLPPIDRTVAALITDLEERNLLDETIVYVVGEFNRTPKVNGSAGRDHWARSMAVLLAGGGLPRGQVFGSTTADGAAPAEDACLPEDLSATLMHLLGIDPLEPLRTRTGRTIAMFPAGTVLAKLVA